MPWRNGEECDLLILHAFGKGCICSLKIILSFEVGPKLEFFPMLLPTQKKLTLGYTQAFQMTVEGQETGGPKTNAL